MWETISVLVFFLLPVLQLAEVTPKIPARAAPVEQRADAERTAPAPPVTTPQAEVTRITPAD